ncbi:hypothetical protein ROD_22781 [Citrobacter rodentium ICC168]|uniref:Uncharacterized protein n=1 Tax=Citrobacter rodentium (strain ICC168) TaxID=637910 RepID=D2TRH9_CITRI|nr:hypothetical protein ROD_22781 [Citrobacter rodentium ICC168]
MRQCNYDVIVINHFHRGKQALNEIYTCFWSVTGQGRSFFLKMSLGAILTLQ